MDRHIRYTIENEQSAMSVGEYLKHKNYSSQSISNLKHISDGIMLNGKRAYVTEKLEAGDHIDINIYEETSSEKIPPVEMKLDIIYEDEDLIVLNKPADMPVHPSMNNYENTLANGLAFYYGNRGENFVFRCMNRLDRNTTGAVLVAKNAISGAMLSQMIRERSIEKEYVAIATGCIEEELFTIDAPIGRVEGSTIERRVDYESGERAVTHVKLLRKNDRLSFISCELETGRTHQIRVHLAHIGHPLIGDGLYNPACGRGRQALHCARLEFTQPVTGEHICAEAPLAKDMERIIEDEQWN